MQGPHCLTEQTLTPRCAGLRLEPLGVRGLVLRPRKGTGELGDRGWHASPLALHTPWSGLSVPLVCMEPQGLAGAGHEAGGKKCPWAE